MKQTKILINGDAGFRTHLQTYANTVDTTSIWIHSCNSSSIGMIFKRLNDESKYLLNIHVYYRS